MTLFRMYSILVFLPTPSARRATIAQRAVELFVQNISTHALREEGDVAQCKGYKRFRIISTHALREEGDFSSSGTRPNASNFYPRPPRGGRR